MSRQQSPSQFRRRQLLSLIFPGGDSRRPVRAAWHPRLEVLEDRALLATILWSNRDSGGGDADGFVTAFGTAAAADTARAVVDRAMSDWGQLITNFNYANVGSPGQAPTANTYTITLSLTDLVDPGFRATTSVDGIDAQGRPFDATIDMDDNGGGDGWFIDPTPGDDAEFTTLLTAFTATGAITGRDFYSTAVHEVGHAMGTATAAALAINNFLSAAGTDQIDGAAPLFLFSGATTTATFVQLGGRHTYEGPVDPAFPGNPIHPNDLMNAGRSSPPTGRRLPTDLNVGILRDAYGYTMLNASLFNTFYANLNTATGVLTVNGAPGVSNDQITIDRSGGSLRVSVNNTQELFPLGSVTSINVLAGGGTDTVTIDYTSGLPLPAGGLTLNGGGGTGDTLRVLGGAFTTITNNYTNATDGSVVLVQAGPVSRTITYTNLAPVLLNVGSVSNILFNLPNVSSDVLLANDSPANFPSNGLNTANTSALGAATFEYTAFTNPTNSLTVFLGNGGDAFEIGSLDPTFNADLTINGGNVGDSFVINSVTGSGKAWQINGNPGIDSLEINYAATVAITAPGAGTVSSTIGLSILQYTSIEDFKLRADYGDAPDTYGTSLANSGPYHPATSTLSLGTVDTELFGLPSFNALLDDQDNTDDENGVAFANTLIARLDAKFTITATAAGKLDAWIDYNRNGVFDAAEQIASSLSLVAGSNTLLITVPATALSGATFARFRVSTAGGLGPTGAAIDGEVEDYALNLLQPTPGTIVNLEDPANPTTGLLMVTGRSMSDAIVVRPVAGNPALLETYINPSTVTAKTPAASVQRIVVFGLDGSDAIVIDSQLLTPAQVFGDAGYDSIAGGSGNDILDGGGDGDTIAGGNGHDIIYGGTGDDTLSGDAGRDIVIGGAGTDTIIGGLDDDINIGGNTTLSSVQVQAARALWISGATFNARLASLAGTFNATTVIDDGVADYVYGSGGRDWLLDFALRDYFWDYDANALTGDRKN